MDFILELTISFFASTFPEVELHFSYNSSEFILLLRILTLKSFFSCKLEHGQLWRLGQDRLYFIQQNILDQKKHLRFPINI